MSTYNKYLRRVLKHHYPERAETLITAVERHFQAIAPDIQFVASSSNPIDKRLVFCSYFLALIKSLESAGAEFVTIRGICLELVTDYVRPKNKIQAFVKRVIPGLINTWIGRKLIGSLRRKVATRYHENGFRANILTDRQQTLGFGYGVDILECGICKIFTKHGAGRYASILCEVDEITSSLAGLDMVRSGTIANGAEKCDFRYRKKSG